MRLQSNVHVMQVNHSVLYYSRPYWNKWLVALSVAVQLTSTLISSFLLLTTLFN